MFSLKDIVFLANLVISSSVEIDRSTRLACSIFPAACSPALPVKADSSLFFVLPYVNRKGQRWCHTFDVAQHKTQLKESHCFLKRPPASFSNDGLRLKTEPWGRAETASATYGCSRSSVGCSVWCWNEPFLHSQAPSRGPYFFFHLALNI